MTTSFGSSAGTQQKNDGLDGDIVRKNYSGRRFGGI